MRYDPLSIIFFREHPDKVVERTFRVPASLLSGFNMGTVTVAYGDHPESPKEVVHLHPEDAPIIERILSSASAA